MEKSYLKVYPACFWGDDVSIIGTKPALLKLKEVIDNALNETNSTITVEETDDIPYKVSCKMISEDFIVTGSESFKLPLHYTDDKELEFTEEEKQMFSHFINSTVDNDR